MIRENILHNTTIISFGFIFLVMTVAAVIALVVKYIKLLIKHNHLNKFLYTYLNIITSARYGNLNSKCPEACDALTSQMSKNTNALLESIKDRDIMINEYIEREKQSQNIKQDFISSLAHDLKVPLIAQDNTYDLFLEGSFGQLSESQKDAINNLKISNNDLKNLVINLLDAQKLDIKDFETNIEDTNLNELINEVIEQNKSILKIKQKEAIFEKNEDITYPLDPFLIKRALNNLLSNAIKYSKNSKTIIIRLEKNLEGVVISFIDEGDGIKEDEINHLFTKYYTGAKKYSDVGLGLGLYIVNKIMLAHKGKLSAQNNKEKGANFSLIFPDNIN